MPVHDLEKLREAWPDGFLAMRGLATVGGYIIRKSQTREIFIWTRSGRDAEQPPPDDGTGSHWTTVHSKRMSPDQSGKNIAPSPRMSDTAPTGGPTYRVPCRVQTARWHADCLLGDLLPNVDPADTASWYCLLLDLARAKGWTGKMPDGTEAVVTGLTWRYSPGTSSWTLHVHFARGWRRWPYRFDVEEGDPAVALVEARILCRQLEAS